MSYFSEVLNYGTVLLIDYEVFNLNKFVVVDIETTGHSPKNGDRMIQFAAVVLENQKIIETYTTYINPEISIPPFITELTGIDNNVVMDAPKFSEVATEIVALLNDACFVAHNVQFDLKFLQEELEVHQFPKLHVRIIDTVEMTRILMPTMESYKLSDIADFAGFNHDRPHQADSDAIVTAEWFLTLYDKLVSLPSVTLLQLQKLAKRLKSDLFYLIDRIYSERESGKHYNQKEVEISNGIALKMIGSKDESQFKDDIKNNCSSFERFLRENNYSEVNEESMSSFIYQSLKDGELSLIEATGFNRYYDYLLSAYYFSLEKNQPILIVASSNKHLQMMTEEVIPKLQKLTNNPFNVQILKGRNRYLNLWKFEQSLREESDHFDEILTKMQILVWLLETETGDGDELNLSTGGRQFWLRISTGQTNLLSNVDFYGQALARAQSAKIVLTNHHYFISDLVGAKKDFDHFEYVIIDDAHVLEKNALQIVGNKLSYRQIKYILNQLGNADQLKTLGKVDTVLQNYHLKTKVNSNQLDSQIHVFLELFEEFSRLSIGSVVKRNQQNDKVVFDENLMNYRQIMYSWERVYDAYVELFTNFENWLDVLNQNYHRLLDKEKMLVDNYSLLLNKLNCIRNFNDEFQQLHTNKIIWIGVDERNPITSLVYRSQPLYLDEFFAHTLYLHKKSIILISNALTVDKSFQYMIERLGLLHFPIVTRQFSYNSSFNNKIRLFSLNDLPNINEINESEFIEHICNHILAIATTFEKQILIVFNSNAMLKKVYNLIKDSGALEEYLLLAHGISNGSVNRLTKQFMRFSKSILFTTTSYLEYMNEVSSLQTVIMVRLPFTSPFEPVHFKRAKLLENKGVRTFYSLSLPEAVIRFKDTIEKLLIPNGQKNLILFDNRVYTTDYGRSFLQSIQDISLEVVDINQLCDEIVGDSNKNRD